MKPAQILLAVRLGIDALNDKHAIVNSLWRRFGGAIRRARFDRDVSVKRLARHLGVTTAMLGMLERGKRTWTIKRAEKAVRYVGRPEQWPDGGR